MNDSKGTLPAVWEMGCHADDLRCIYSLVSQDYVSISGRDDSVRYAI